jgi:hypothetical protein
MPNEDARPQTQPTPRLNPRAHPAPDEPDTPLEALDLARSRVFVRNFAAEEMLELFMVSAVLAVLVIRFMLQLSGYPQLGGSGLHIAHMLWGGVLMLVALFLVLVYLGQRVMRLAAVVGGLGFGVFVDELGKFITSDNNYFYRPAIALIYLVFVAIFLILRAVSRKRAWSQETYLINVLVVLQEAVLHDLDSAEHRQALTLLQNVRPAPDSLAAPIRSMIAALPALQRRRRSLLDRMARLAREHAHRALASRWLPRVLSMVFAVRVVVFLVTSVVVGVGYAMSGGRPSPLELVAFSAALLSNAMGIAGIVSLLRSRFTAFSWFKRALIVSIFLADVFAFYQQQLAALSSLSLDIVLLVTVNALLRHELLHRQADPRRQEQPFQSAS